jgi:endonuclease/exonuclease/phosphatase family metal-dependent hydrolase
VSIFFRSPLCASRRAGGLPTLRSVGNGAMLRLVTFNVLAPMYRRLLRPNGQGTTREDIDRDGYRRRHRAIIGMLAGAAADVICLQEFWFEDEFSGYYEGALGNRYDFVGMQRTGFKADGVMILVNRAKFQVVTQRPLEFRDDGDRVALFVTLQSHEQGHRVVVGTTHLTFPHARSYVQLAYDQTAKLLRCADDLQGRMTAPVILAGDFNSEPDSPVYASVIQQRYVDAWLQCNHHKHLGIQTHHNHRGQRVCVDYIFYRNPTGSLPSTASSLAVTDSNLLPLHLRPEHWPAPEDFDSSDHRPVVADFILGPHDPRDLRAPPTAPL